MPWGYAATAVGSYLGSSGALGGGGGGTQSPISNSEIQAYAKDYGNNLNQYQNSNQGIYNKTSPVAQQGFGDTANNPYAAGSVVGAAQGGQYMQGAGQQAIGNANQLSAAGNQLYQSAFDPQTALYQQQQQQLANQTNAYNANNGIASSPYGASVAANAQGNFQNQWQNQQLGREAQGVQAMSGADTSANNLYTGGANAYAQGAAMPYNQQNTVGNNLMNDASSYYGTASPYMTYQGNLQNMLSTFMGMGSSDQNQAFNQNMDNSLYANQMGQQLGQSGIGQQLGNAWNNWGATPNYQQTNWGSNGGMNSAGSTGMTDTLAGYSGYGGGV